MYVFLRQPIVEFLRLMTFQTEAVLTVENRFSLQMRHVVIPVTGVAGNSNPLFPGLVMHAVDIGIRLINMTIAALHGIQGYGVRRRAYEIKGLNVEMTVVAVDFVDVMDGKLELVVIEKQLLPHAVRPGTFQRIVAVTAHALAVLYGRSGY